MDLTGENNHRVSFLAVEERDCIEGCGSYDELETLSATGWSADIRRATVHR